MLKQSITLFVLAACAAPSAMASNYPSQTFDASYVITSSAGKTNMRMASDGKGHLYTETSAGGQQYGSIIDYINGTSVSLIPQGKMAMKSKLPSDGGYVADEASIKEKNGKSIGSKSVNGHPCHGYEYTAHGAQTQTWIGDDCKIVVQSVTKSSAGNSTMDLKAIAGKPAASLFEIPAGYKTMGQ